MKRYRYRYILVRFSELSDRIRSSHHIQTQFLFFFFPLFFRSSLVACLVFPFQSPACALETGSSKYCFGTVYSVVCFGLKSLMEQQSKLTLASWERQNALSSLGALETLYESHLIYKHTQSLLIDMLPVLKNPSQFRIFKISLDHSLKPSDRFMRVYLIFFPSSYLGLRPFGEFCKEHNLNVMLLLLKNYEMFGCHVSSVRACKLAGHWKWMQYVPLLHCPYAAQPRTPNWPWPGAICPFWHSPLQDWKQH